MPRGTSVIYQRKMHLINLRADSLYVVALSQKQTYFPTDLKAKTKSADIRV